MITGTLTIQKTIVSGTLTTDGVTANGTVSTNTPKINGQVSPGIFAVDNPALEERVTDLENNQVNDKNYEEIFSTPQTTFIVNHNLDKYPAVSFIDSANEQWQLIVSHNNKNTLTMIAETPISGTVFCN